MRRGIQHVMIICMILVVSLLFGVILNTILTGIERQKYPFSYQDTLSECAESCKLPASLLCAVIYVESGFEASATSKSGDIGLFQLSPETYEQIRAIFPEELNPDPAVLYDPTVNLRCGAYWLQALYIRYGSWDIALAAFHTSTDIVDQWLADDTLQDASGKLKAIPDTATASYLSSIKKVQAIYERLYEA